MKNKNLFLFLLLILFKTASSQWIPQVSGTSIELTKVNFINASTGFVIGHNLSLNRYVLRRTTNSGLTWDSIIYSFQEKMNNFFFLNTALGWTAGSIAPSNKIPLARIRRTTNGGASWLVTDLPDTASLQSVFFIDALTGYAVGYKDPTSTVVVRTINGGINWTTLTNIPTDITSARDVYFLNLNTGWIVGTKSTAENRYPSILRTTNGGFNWLNSDLNGYIRTFLSYIVFLNAQTGYAAGSRDTTIAGTLPYPRMFKSTNGGAGWVYQDLPWNVSPNIQFINGIYFADANTGWAVGNRGSISYTSNGGTNWGYQPSGTSTTVNLEDVYFNSGLGWVVGNPGVVIKTTNGGVTFIQPISNETPDKFSLEQNYPNPFNPNTKIIFQVARTPLTPLSQRGDNVRLVVYDVLGREVATLVNEQLKPGTYEVDFDGSNLGSGIYYYKLVAGDFVETKKMVLIK